MNGTCFECKFMRNRTDLEPCEHCTNTFAMTGVHPSFTPKKPPITNYDLLIRKTPEELADWLDYEFGHCEWCDSERIGVDECENHDCRECILYWLNKEAENVTKEE